MIQNKCSQGSDDEKGDESGHATGSQNENPSVNPKSSGNSKNAKFSRHLIIRIQKTAFKDNSHVGAFVTEESLFSFSSIIKGREEFSASTY
ncbi:hypothetical protein RchiOBHm_Chr2g0085031 [Rosa chinensis]|uniref:Uncharacterized protein n=1 Tax=Rosa chinensis TaxID=74649 RepID=A0A2P6RHZ9_ROSCH|nr:hypothetical protein RchiOBHm_Chr2g0085031 [Rosa chinensis]